MKNDLMRQDTAKQYRNVRRLLRVPVSEEMPAIEWNYIVCVGAIVFALCVILFSYSLSYAYTDEQAIKSIIGEAENQGQIGMLYVACAIRNRGTLSGVYGSHSKRVLKELYSSKTYIQSTWAWAESIKSPYCNELGGATNWENINQFGKPKWAMGMVETFRYRDHVFYAEVIK